MSEIELKDIVKTYDGKANVIEKLSVNIEKGEFFVLVGPSGCGKSTLLRIIAGLEDISSGEIKIQGKVANNMLAKDRNLTMVFQNYALYPHMSVRDNILFGLDLKKISKEEQRQRLKETAELVGLGDLLDRKPSQLSGGQRQRVALARSICSHAPICLMDEPLSNLDAKLRAQMRIEIKRLQRKTGMTMIYVTHDQVEAMTMGDRIMVLDSGVIQQVGSPITLYNNPKNLFVGTFIGSPKMNVANANVVNNRLILNNHLLIKMDEIHLENLPDGDTFIVGIRPENIEVVERENMSNCAAKIVNIEALGNETQIAFESGDEVFIARLNGQWNFNVNDSVYLYINPDDLLFFDKHTKQLIRSSMQWNTSNVVDTLDTEKVIAEVI